MAFYPVPFERLVLCYKHVITQNINLSLSFGVAIAPRKYIGLALTQSTSVHILQYNLYEARDRSCLVRKLKHEGAVELHQTN